MLKVNFWDILFTIVNVLVIFWILKKFLFNRIMNVINEREANIKDQFTEADNRKKEADEEKAKYLKKQDAAEQEAAAIVKKSRQLWLPRNRVNLNRAPCSNSRVPSEGPRPVLQ